MRKVRSIFLHFVRTRDRYWRCAAEGAAQPETWPGARALVFLLGLMAAIGGCRAADSQPPPMPPEERVAEESSPPPVLHTESITTEVRNSTTSVRSSTTSSSSSEFTNHPEPTQDWWSEEGWSEEGAPEKPEKKKCCRVCRVGKACGNTCIARDHACHAPPGCACDQ